MKSIHAVSSQDIKSHASSVAGAGRMLPGLLLLFIGSGCAALIYEIVRFQLLQLVIGLTNVSLGLLLGIFMGGMCLGSLLLPRLISPPASSFAGLRTVGNRHRADRNRNSVRRALGVGNLHRACRTRRFGNVAARTACRALPFAADGIDGCNVTGDGPLDCFYRQS
jgi:hypothetical protein